MNLKEIIKKHKLWLSGDPSGERADLTGADLTGADLTGANLTDASLRGANLTHAELAAANFYCANLRGANLEGADFSGANLTGSNLEGANLSGAKLRYANMWGADFSGANLTGSNIEGVAGNMREIKSMQIDTWPVTYTHDTLQIGCQRHTIQTWIDNKNDLEWIELLDEGAVDWVERGLLDAVLKIIELSPAMNTQKD